MLFGRSGKRVLQLFRPPAVPSYAHLKFCSCDINNFPEKSCRVSNDMVLTFLGTASCQPSASRGVSCTALRMVSGSTWLFDVGEASQLQLQKSQLRPSKITKIFITHMHGDHTFGLPGVLCMLGSANEEISFASGGSSEDTCIDIYGPEGIRDMLRVALQLSQSRVAVPHRIHELKGMLRGEQLRVLRGVSTTLRTEYGERRGGRDIYPDKDGRYLVFDSDEATVSAALMKHTIPCLGYVVDEKMKRGAKLKVDEVTDIVKRNDAALKKQYDLTNSMKIANVLKLLPSGDTFSFPDGTVVAADDILIRQSPRRVVLLGDTSDAAAIAPLAAGADILVHEATTAWFSHQERADTSNNKFKSEKAFDRGVIRRGHSTPQMAGKFAKRIGAKKLVLSHFSARYDNSDESTTDNIMGEIEQMAARASGLTGEGEVVAARDFMSIPVTR